MLTILIKWLVITIFWESPLACPGLLCLNLKRSVGPDAIPQCICHNLIWKAQLTQPDTHTEPRLRNQQGSARDHHTGNLHRHAPFLQTPLFGLPYTTTQAPPSSPSFPQLFALSLKHTHTHTSTDVIRCFPPDASIPVLQLQIQGCHQKPNKIHQ